MRLLKLILVVLVTVWLQLQFLGAIRPAGVLPNLLLIVIIYAGLRATASEAVGIAIGGGLLLDLASGTDFGLRMAFYSALALAVVVARRSGADFEQVVLVLAVTAISTLGFNLAVLIGLLGSGSHWPIGYIAVKIGIEMILNVLLALVLGPLVIKTIKVPVSQGVTMGRLK